MSSLKKILIVVGTRPNFIKITQFPGILNEYKGKFNYKIVHTGQHFDDKMSSVFFEQFDLIPDFFLNIESGPPEDQKLEISKGLEKIILDYRPDVVLVVGDVNSTVAAARAAQKMNVKVAHVESGLRSFDNSMPEELNRVITDEISEYCFVTEQSGIDNLLREGKPSDQIFFVGNTMIDTMVAYKDRIDLSDILKRISAESGKFCLMTMHRPANVDSEAGLVKLIGLLGDLTKKIPVVFPIHPRTVKQLKQFGLYETLSSLTRLVLTGPLDYFSFQKLIKECKFIITDSGGIQEESTFQKIPCLTLRANTERPSTVTIGTNELIPFDLSVILDKIEQIEKNQYKQGAIPPLWDGRSTERIVEVLSKAL